jgi:hypothetical protein
MAVDPSMGGRIVSFALDGHELLAGKDVLPEGYGSTFWPSPQSMWNWPPLAALDNEPYSVLAGTGPLRLASGTDPGTGFQVGKEFRAGKNNAVHVTYTIVNTGSETRKAAPWEISRVGKGGLFFFPAGKGPMRTKHFDPVPTDVVDGVVWYQDPAETPRTNQLSIGDGSEGWIAYASGGRVLIRKFEDTGPDVQAPGEAEVELYVNSGDPFLELEAQGPYGAIAPGAASSWTVEWTAAAVPESIPVEKGSAKLVAFVRGIVGKR